MSRSCKECAHHNPDFIDEVCLHCSWPEFAGEPSNFKPKPITKADLVRAMTDEELAEWYWWMLRYVQGYTDSRVALRDWLKGVAEEGER